MVVKSQLTNWDAKDPRFDYHLLALCCSKIVQYAYINLVICMPKYINPIGIVDWGMRKQISQLVAISGDMPMHVKGKTL